MSVVAISENMGSLGVEIGHAVAASLGYQFAERDIISKAADRFGEDAGRLSHAVEERPTLVDRLSTTQRRFSQYVEATVQEMAARDDIVLVGLASTIILARTPHTLRARVTASEGRRAERVVQALGLDSADALDRVRQSDRERAGRVWFLYHVDLENPLLYDLVIRDLVQSSQVGIMATRATSTGVNDAMTAIPPGRHPLGQIRWTEL